MEKKRAAGGAGDRRRRVRTEIGRGLVNLLQKLAIIVLLIVIALTITIIVVNRCCCCCCNE